MKIFIEYDPPNWNDYINLERKNIYGANNLKQYEKQVIRYCIDKQEKYNGKYPVEIIIRKHFKDRRQDLDNTRIKGLIDGLVTHGIIKNDNLTCIQRLVFEPVFDKKIGIEIEIRELGNEK